MKDSVDLKTYYLIILPAVILIVIGLLTRDFTYKIQFSFFIVIISFISLSVVSYFERKGQKEGLQQIVRETEETLAEDEIRENISEEQGNEKEGIFDNRELPEETNAFEYINSENSLEIELEASQLAIEKSDSDALSSKEQDEDKENI